MVQQAARQCERANGECVDVREVFVFVSERLLYSIGLLGTGRPDYPTTAEFSPRQVEVILKENGCDQKPSFAFNQGDSDMSQNPTATMPRDQLPQMLTHEHQDSILPGHRYLKSLSRGKTRWQMNTWPGPSPSHKADRRNS